MEAKLKELIIRDYKISLKNIERISSGKRINGFIKSPNQYLSPSTRLIPLPLNDKRGEFIYYNQICETLEKLLAGEKAKYTCHFNESPQEIKNLLVQKPVGV